MPTSLFQSYHSFLKAFFGTHSDTVAKQTRFAQRSSPLSGSLFLQSLVWTAFKQSLFSLNCLTATAEHLDSSCKVSQQAFHLRFSSQAETFLQAMFALALHQSLDRPQLVLPLISAFTAVYLLDSSQVALPDSLSERFTGCGGNGPCSAAKLYFLLDWLTGSYSKIQIGPANKPDQQMGCKFISDRPAGALWIMDLGFWNIDFLSSISNSGSYFICRLQSQTAVWIKDSSANMVRFDLDKFLKFAPRDKRFEMAIYLGRKQSVECRLICARVSDEIANQRRRRARESARKRGRRITKRHLMRQSWTLFVTNAEQQKIATTAVEAVYSIRWQVELAFKLAKSEAGLGKSNSKKASRVMCEFYAKLIALVLFDDLLAVVRQRGKESISPARAWRRLRDKLWQWGRRLLKGKGFAELKQIVEYLRRRAKTDGRKKYPSTVEKVKSAIKKASNRVLIKPIEYLKKRSKGEGIKPACFGYPIVDRGAGSCLA